MTSVLWALLLFACGSQVMALLLVGHRAYLWVQGSEAIACSAALLWFGLRDRRQDPRERRWPPLLPLAAIAVTGGTKDLYVALDQPTPWWLIAMLLASVLWFLAASWVVWRVEDRRAARKTQGGG